MVDVYVMSCTHVCFFMHAWRKGPCGSRSESKTVDDELIELLAELSAKLLAELSAKLLAELSAKFLAEFNHDVLFGIHSGSEGECSNDVHLFCVVYIRGQKGSARMIYIYFCLIYIWGRKGSARMIYICFYLIYIRGQKGSARMIYICFVWYTFGVGRGVLE